MKLCETVSKVSLNVRFVVDLSLEVKENGNFGFRLFFNLDFGFVIFNSSVLF